MSLTDKILSNAKPTTRIVKISFGEGLQCWIMPLPAGSKLWRIAYRFEGKQKLHSFGAYPTITLKAARDKLVWLKGLLADGIDPATQKRDDEDHAATAKENTFALIASELLAKKRREGKASNTIGKREWLYSLAGEAFGKRPITEITAQEVLAALRTVESKGLYETARRMRSSIGEVFRYAIATARATADPTFALRGALTVPTVKHRAAITDPKELGALLRAIDGFQGQPTTIAALKLMALLFPRPGELRLAEWKEFDLQAAVWTIPAARTKMRREHRVPLSRQALAILESLHPITGHAALVFPGLQGHLKPISENTLNLALRRLGYSQDEATAHGFRATASSLLNESGKFSVDVIECALAHQDKDAIRRAYARGEHWQERVTMAQWWADHLDTLRDGAKVLAFDKRA